MGRKKTKSDHVKDAAKARSDINMFYAIISLCESSLFSSDSHNAEGRIVAICKRESARCLVRYDDALAKIGVSKHD